jgi:hypothetical protein
MELGEGGIPASMTKVKSGFTTFLIIAAALIILPKVTTDRGPDSGPEYEFGPRRVGLDNTRGCRFMSFESELLLTLAQRKQGLTGMTGRLDADFGTAGKGNQQRITVPDYDTTHRYFKQEFCAQPGSRVRGVVTLDLPVELLDCYFYKGPQVDADSVKGNFGPKTGPRDMIAWCEAVVPP